MDLRANRIYKRILASIQHLGVIEALSVYEEEGKYYLLDGYLRLKALEGLGITEVPCFVYRHRDRYTFNAMRNDISPSQEHRMLKQALDRGVDEAELARILKVSPTRLRQTKRSIRT